MRRLPLPIAAVVMLAFLLGGVALSRSGAGHPASPEAGPASASAVASAGRSAVASASGAPSPVGAPAPRSSPVRPAPAPTARGRAATVALLRSEPSLRVLGTLGRWESEEAEKTLRAMGVPVRVVGEGDLAEAVPSGIRVLVVPDSRCISPRVIASVRRFVARGGGLLATSMTSYRDDENRRVGAENEFQWADLYGASFRRWVSGSTECDALALDPALAREVATALASPEARPRVALARNLAMRIAARPGTRILATWIDAAGKPAPPDPGNPGAAIVESADGRVIYAGENLLAPELTRSPQVRALLLALLHRLEAAGIPPRLPGAGASARTAFPFAPPPEPASAPPSDGPEIRVGVSAGMAAAGVTSGAGIHLEGMLLGGGTLALDFAPGQAAEVRVVATALAAPYLAVYDGEGRLKARAQTPVRARSHDPAGSALLMDLRENGACRARAHRGTLELSIRGDRVAVVGVLGIDAYTAGVVPNEVPGTYPPEALASMAVIARTFALSRRGFHRKDGFDLCSTVHCQVYGGATTEWEATTRAVAETAGEVIHHGSALADTTFHAVCGGVGEDVERVWVQGPVPYLKGHADGPREIGDLSSEAAFRAFIDRPPDAYCSASPRFRWSESYPRSDLQAIFEKSLPVTLGASFRGLGTLRSVSVLGRSRFGRVQAMEIVGTGGTYRVEKDAIRWLWSGGHLGVGGLQSTLFHIEVRPGTEPTFVFRGGGWGHGVGMCQEGARGMAARGLDHRAIIRHYYPGTTVTPRRTGTGATRPTGGCPPPPGGRTAARSGAPSR